MSSRSSAGSLGRSLTRVFAALAFVATGAVGCAQQHDEGAATRVAEASAHFNHGDSTRLDAILQQNANHEPFLEALDYLSQNGMAIDISAQGMSAGSAVRVFKDRIQVNPFMTVNLQDSLIESVVTYIQGQVRDRQPYGVGESFQAFYASGRVLLVPAGEVPGTTGAVVAPTANPR